MRFVQFLFFRHALVSIEITIINKIYFRSIFQIYFMQYIVLFIIRLFSFLNPSHPYITVSREYSLDTVERPLHWNLCYLFTWCFRKIIYPKTEQSTATIAFTKIAITGQLNTIFPILYAVYDWKEKSAILGGSKDSTWLHTYPPVSLSLIHI